MKNKNYAIVILFFLGTYLLISCTNDSTKPVEEEKKADPMLTSPISGYYLLLSGNVADFKRLNNNKCQSLSSTPPKDRKGRKIGSVLFKYRIAPNGLELDGWQVVKKGSNDNGFSANPNIKLSSAGNSTIAYAENTYIGTILMDNCFLNQLRSISDRNPDLPFVVFIPKYSAGNSFISYEIILSNSRTAKESDFDEANFTGKKFMRVPVGDLDNPVPPGGGGILDNNE